MNDPVNFVDIDGLRIKTTAGATVGFHYLLGGASGSYNYRNNSITVCVTDGLGLYFGAFGEGGIEYNSEEKECKEDNLTFGLSGNWAFEYVGANAHVRGNNSGITAGTRGRRGGIGLGASGGLDICYTIYL